MIEQLDPATGKLRHLLTLEGLTKDIYSDLFSRAASCLDPDTGKVKSQGTLKGKVVVNVFFEPSTRTRMSFEIAARLLGAEVVNFDADNSSVATKGETFCDTLRVIESLGADVVVVRKSGNLQEDLGEDWPDSSVTIVNAGDGCNAHPSQGLLDAWTVTRKLGAVAGLTVAIIGDIRNSRVARSLAHAYATLGAAVRVAGPPDLLPSADALAQLNMEKFTDVDSAVKDADVVVCLRFQAERNPASVQHLQGEYVASYRMDARRMALAKPNALLMHPGPMNRGVEISSEVADGANSCVFEQVANGVAMRMAIMQLLCER